MGLYGWYEEEATRRVEGVDGPGFGLMSADNSRSRAPIQRVDGNVKGNEI